MRVKSRLDEMRREIAILKKQRHDNIKAATNTETGLSNIHCTVRDLRIKAINAHGPCKKITEHAPLNT